MCPLSQCRSCLSGSGLQVLRVPFVSWAACCTSYNADCGISLAPDSSLSLSLTRTWIQLHLQHLLGTKLLSETWEQAAALARSFQAGFSRCPCSPCTHTRCPSQDLLPSLWWWLCYFGAQAHRAKLRISKGSFKCSIKEGMQGEKKALTRMASFSFPDPFEVLLPSLPACDLPPLPTSLFLFSVFLLPLTLLVHWSPFRLY